MAAKKPEGALDDIIRGAIKVASKQTKKATKKVVQSKANPRNSYALGRTVVHGSPTRGLRTITPRKGSKALPDESVVFVWDPKDFGQRSGMLNSVKPYTQNTGSVYVGKVPRGGYKKTMKGVGASSKPMKVKKEIVDTNKTMDLDRSLKRELLRQGVVKKPTVAGVKSKTKKVVRKAEDIASKNKKIKKAIAKNKGKNSIV